jgi:hypothetical protein
MLNICITIPCLHSTLQNMAFANLHQRIHLGQVDDLHEGIYYVDIRKNIYKINQSYFCGENENHAANLLCVHWQH